MLHVMPGTTELEALITRLANDRTLLQRGEAATRMGAVNPTLRALGWDTDNLDEVDPEFGDGGGGKVDYCLRHRGRNLVLIEAKRASEELANHQGQLLHYAFGLGVYLAALTNGLDWWLYLPMKGGRPFEERRFARIDFREPDAAAAAAALNRFLNRDEVASGATLKEAEDEFERQEREQEIRAVMPDAWGRLLGDQRLHDLFAQMVEEVSGHRPNPQTLGEFLRGMPGGRAALLDDPVEPQPVNGGDSADEAQSTATAASPFTAGQRGRPSPADLVVALLHEVGTPLHYREIERRLRESGKFEAGGKDPADTLLGRFFNDARLHRTGRGTYALLASGEASPIPTDQGSQNASPDGPAMPDPTTFTGRSPAAFWLGGTRYEAARWRAVLQGVCGLMAAESGVGFGDQVAHIRGRTRLYFSRQPEDLFRAVSIEGSNWFVEGNLNANDCVRFARRVLVVVPT